jgi:hypothetical protein
VGRGQVGRVRRVGEPPALLALARRAGCASRATGVATAIFAVRVDGPSTINTVAVLA